MKTGLFTFALSTIFTVNSLFLPIKPLSIVNLKPQIEIIAHRGFEDMFPENTIYAAQEAIKLGGNPEFDVQFTKDGEMVIMHDYSVDRTTNGTGIVSNLSYSYIKTLGAGIKFSNNFSGLSVPKFTDYLEAVRDSNHVYPELKTFRNRKDITTFTKTLIDYDYEDKATIISFNYLEVLPVIRKSSRKINVGAICRDKTSFNKTMQIAKKDKHSMVLIPISLANKDTLYKCRISNIQVGVWTIHDSKMLDKLKSIGYTRFICSKSGS